MIFITLLFSSSISVALQIDIGCESMRSSMMQRGNPVEIVINGLGRRTTPSVAAILPISADAPAIFTDEDVHLFKRSVGDLSVVQKYPKNSSRFLPQLLGKNYSSKLVSYFLRRNLTMPFDADEDEYLELIAPPEFFAAQLIQSAIKDCKNTKINRTVDDLALVIPKFLTHHQRTAFVRSAKLATYNPTLIETFAAVGALFALERSQLYKKEALTICFIDIGASQMQVSMQEFSRTEKGTEINELGYAWNDQYGSFSIDAQIAKVIRREVTKAKPDAVFDDKSVQRILAAARQVKHELTLQPKVSLFLEDLVHGFDMTFTYSMEKLQRRCKRELRVLNDTFFEAFKAAGFNAAEDIDRIELIGGGTRSPLFVDAINATFAGKIPVLRSLNTEEAAVIGAGYVVASKRGGYLTNEIKFNNFDTYNITFNKCNHTSANNNIVQIYYDDGQKLPIGIKPYIRTVDLGQRGSYEVVNGRVRVHGCKKLSTSGLDKNKRFRVEKILQAFEGIEKKQSEHDKMIHNYTTYLIETREKLTKDENVMRVSSAEERGKALRLIANMQYQIQKDSNIEENELIRMKIDIEEATSLIFKKATDKAEAPEAYEKLAELLETINRVITVDWPEKGFKPKGKYLKTLGKMCHRTEKWLDQHEDNLEGVSADEINIMFERLQREFAQTKAKIQSHYDFQNL